MYDTVIRGGTVVDGTGAAAYRADVAVQDGVIVEIGRVTSPARESIDADGALVTPGFIDLHTHYDGQFLWDDTIDPSFSHGVTTAIAGNCGVGFAPVVPEHRQQLIEVMEGVEDIPGLVLDEGLDWDWRSFPDYLDRIAARRYSMDVASHLTHAPLRVFVMGERALEHQAATAEDIRQMADLLRQAMDAGALGFSTGRLVEHISSSGAKIPGTFAEEVELIALAEALGESGRGVFQIVPKGAIGAVIAEADGRDERLAEHRLYERIATAAGRPVTYSITEVGSDPEDIWLMVAESEKAASAGLELRPQIATRGTGLISLLDGYHVFLMKPSYREIAHLPVRERIAAMREPARRRAILDEEHVEGEYADQPIVGPMLRRMQVRLPLTYVLSSPLDYEPGPDRTVGMLAAAAGTTPEEFIYDHYTATDDGGNFNVIFALNYANGNLDHVHGLLEKPVVLSSLADGGAHMKVMCDASQPTFQLAFWTRDRTRGPLLPLELAVHKLTGAGAALYGLDDRGTVEVGRRADLNVIDYDRLQLDWPRMVGDLPSGSSRMLQGSTGYLATLVAGTTTRRDDADTGARPGRLLRAGAGR
ncbi:N-acyl-D-amino-acid deacylase family protein [Trujillonella endophytica]|uniref:N-acyl-D-aspartate/D-glutamate deacylase n=1 Tax=Trujillonella endophytica TaxID=673521 RepID=A0A1H8Q392_9ACTN|nr:amidohydrolase family protein [Trujillella endophytica]SEO48689.1 N-acyl-D-aspartate/D-glutamate deacylase [Trujillella endophytica]